WVHFFGWVMELFGHGSFPPYGHFASEERMRSSYFHSSAEVQADKPFYGYSCRNSSGVSDGGVPAIKFVVATPHFAWAGSGSARSAALKASMPPRSGLASGVCVPTMTILPRRRPLNIVASEISVTYLKACARAAASCRAGCRLGDPP